MLLRSLPLLRGSGSCISRKFQSLVPSCSAPQTIHPARGAPRFASASRISAIDEIQKRLFVISKSLNATADEERLKELHAAQENIASMDQSEIALLMKEMAELSRRTKELRKLKSDFSDYVSILEQAEKDKDQATAKEALVNLTELSKFAAEFEFRTLMKSEFDRGGCFVEIRSGAGGTEAMDWAEMLLRMYSKWAQSHGFSNTVTDECAGPIAGLKNATLRIDGEYAHGWMRTESGAHRLVRMSPFDTSNKRHTSFASVTVLPILTSDNGTSHFRGIQIPESELKIETMRSGGPGGQHANRTESAVRITHLPTGISVKSSLKSQHQNRKEALEQIKSKLWIIQNQKKHAQTNEIRNATAEADFGSQIRSYVLHPYQMVKDLRSGFQSTHPDLVLDGQLDEFMLASLRHEAIHGSLEISQK